MTVHDWVRQASVRLAASGVDAARMEAQLLVGHALETDRAGVLTHPTAVAPLLADEMLDRRLKGEPLAYILGYREFYSRRFAVNPSVLIPRQETETLVEAALELTSHGSQVLDVGTGSGCLAITIKLEWPDLVVSAVDISDEALTTAKANARNLRAQVEFSLSDLFESVKGPFDLIISNPPYIADDAELPREIRSHEPATALFAGADGLAVYARLAKEAQNYLTPDGLMALELGDGMARKVTQLFDGEGWFTVQTRKDLAGMERVLVIRPG